MRAVQVMYSYHPDAVGGTEVYAASLARELRAHGWDSALCAPGSRDEAYEVDGQRVWRMGTAAALSLEETYGEGCARAAAAFARILDEELPDVVNFHAFTAGASVRACREVKARGIPLVFTYHTPTVSCVRGDLREWGDRPCDGLMQANRCSACLLNSRGVPRVMARVLSQMPPEALSRAAKFAGLRWATALRIPSLVRQRHAATRTLWALSDRVVAVCDWVRDLLIANGVDPAKITVSRQGIDPRLVKEPPLPMMRTGALRIAYLGRVDPTKGMDVLVDALALIPGSAVRLDIYPIAQDDSLWWASLRKRIARDARVTVHEPLAHTQVVETLRAYDLLAVPSHSMETGPLVVYEARAAQIRILGSRLGGIAELLLGAEDGELLEPGSPQAWAQRIAQLAADPAHARRPVPQSPLRTMTHVAKDIALVYAACTQAAGSTR